MQDNPLPLPTTLYDAARVRELDRVAIEGHGIPGKVLMKRAGRAAFRRLLASWPAPAAVTVLAGTGNNGGDGFVIAGLAAQHGLAVRVYQVGDPDKVRGDALSARDFAAQEGVTIQPFGKDLSIDGGVVVDALLGTGLSGDVRGDYQHAIAAINRSGRPVLAVDIPSGLCSDTGRVLGTAVRAAQTVTFIGLKQGLLTGEGPAHVGELHFADLEVPAAVFEQVDSAVQRLDLAALVAAQLPRRPRTAHKGHFGHVLVVGGDRGFAGAAAMAAQAAGRVGAGLVSCATRPEHVSVILARSPEVMAHGVDNAQALEPLLSRVSAVVAGPGLGRAAWGEQLLQRVARLDVPLVLDADALNILSEGRALRPEPRDNWILTPHPGEAARLLGSDTGAIQGDRFAAVTALQRRYGGTVILKGAGTLIADGKQLALSGYGNPGMASGGMGDVLSGVLGGLLAQGLTPADAARLGACLHGRAADLAARVDGERGLLATDLVPQLRKLVNGKLASDHD